MRPSLGIVGDAAAHRRRLGHALFEDEKAIKARDRALRAYTRRGHLVSRGGKWDGRRRLLAAVAPGWRLGACVPKMGTYVPNSGTVLCSHVVSLFERYASQTRAVQAS